MIKEKFMFQKAMSALERVISLKGKLPRSEGQSNYSETCLRINEAVK